MTIFDDGSTASLLQAGALLFILGATLSFIHALRTCDRALAEFDDDDAAVAAYSPWGTS